MTAGLPRGVSGPLRPATPAPEDGLAPEGSAQAEASTSRRIDADHISGHKRKAERHELARGASNRFRIVSQLVIAMKRFQGALNPTYTFGKRAASSTGSGDARAKGVPFDSEETRSRSPALRPAAQAASEADNVSGAEAGRAFPRRGHRATYLVAPLPPVPGERRRSQQALSEPM